MIFIGLSRLRRMRIMMLRVMSSYGSYGKSVNNRCQIELGSFGIVLVICLIVMMLGGIIFGGVVLILLELIWVSRLSRRIVAVKGRDCMRWVLG